MIENPFYYNEFSFQELLLLFKYHYYRDFSKESGYSASS